MPPLAMAETMAPSCSGVMEMPSPKEHILPTPPSLEEISCCGIGAQLLARNVVAGQFAQSELVGVEADFFKSQLASQGLEIGVVGVRQRGGQVHAAAAAQGDLRCLW